MLKQIPILHKLFLQIPRYRKRRSSYLIRVKSISFRLSLLISEILKLTAGNVVSRATRFRTLSRNRGMESTDASFAVASYGDLYAYRSRVHLAPPIPDAAA